MLRISDPILSLTNLTVRFDASDPWFAHDPSEAAAQRDI
jgi:hypothetical protein